MTNWFLINFINAIKESLGLKNNKATSIVELYHYYFPEQEISTSDSFILLGGDSLSYVQLSLELENYLGGILPANWHQLEIKKLEVLKHESIF